MKIFDIVLTAALIFTTPASADVTAGEIAACKAEPTSDCLAEIGIELAMEESTFPRYSQISVLLAQMGRTDDAYALEVHVQKADGASDANAQSMADLKLSAFRVIDDLLAGADSKTAIEGVDESTVQQAYARLTGGWVSGTAIGMIPVLDTNVRKALRDYAKRKDLSTEAKFIAAGNLLRAGDQDEARQLLDRIEIEPTPHLRLSDQIIRQVGTERAFKIYQKASALRPFAYSTLARNESDPKRALLLLQDWLLLIQDIEDRNKQHFEMVLILRTAAKHNQMDFAEQIAAALEYAILSGPDRRREDVAYTLLRTSVALDKSNEEIKERLRVLEDSLESIPDGQRNTMIETLAAVQYARLGDEKSAARLIVHDKWDSLFRVEMPLKTRNALIRIAAKRMNDLELALLLAPVAAKLAHKDASEVERKWAFRMGWQLLAEVPPVDGAHYGQFYDHLIKLAWRSNSPELEVAALSQFANLALENRNARDLIHAAFQRYAVTNWQPR